MRGEPGKHRDDRDVDDQGAIRNGALLPCARWAVYGPGHHDGVID
jgi:hypothetical protein